MTKSLKYFQDMLETHKDLFDNFEKIQEKYSLDSKKFQNEFNEKGEEVLNIIRRYENMLCNESEGGKYGKFSSNLSETFRNIVRKKFPKIDFIGVEVS